MIFIKTKLAGSYVIDLEPIEDERGFFVRSWDKKIFQELGLDSGLVQCSVSFNKTRGTLRGMHYQSPPYEESKLVRCTKGSIYDVIIDIRLKSNTFKQWFSIELTSDNYKMLFIPTGFAHGFQTLENNTEVFYQISNYYMPQYSKGIRWNDENFNINWPITDPIISKKDLSFPAFKEEEL